jgi:pilus assembly protein CpaB
VREVRQAQISPLLGDRIRRLLGARGWPRGLLVRRIMALALIGLAVLLAFAPAGSAQPPSTRIVVADHDLGPGVTVSAADVAVREMPRDLVPAGTLTSVNAVVGHVLGGALRAGEPITDVRLVDPADTALATGGPGASAVPVRLADPAVADLLHPGIRVDVVTTDPDQAGNPLLASDAIVLTVRDADQGPGQPGRLVVLALPQQLATRVAAVSLRQPVTVTLR